jgi:adenylosuccinate lyase
MMANLESTRGLIYSSRVLLALVDTGMLREDAYAIVQEAAMKTWADIREAVPGPSFRDYLESSAGVHGEFPLGFGQLEEIFDPRSFLSRTDVLFERLEGLEF